MAYEDFKDLPRTAASDKVMLHNPCVIILLKIQNMMGINEDML